MSGFKKKHDNYRGFATKVQQILQNTVGKVENETRDNNNSTKRERCFFVLSRAWDKENISESPRGIEPQSFGFRAPML